MRPTSLSAFLSLAALLGMPAAGDALSVVGGSEPQDAAADVAEQALAPAPVPDPTLVPPATAAATTEVPLAKLEEEWADVPDEPAIAEEVDKDSADMEAVRKAEEAAHVQQASPGQPPAAGGRIALIPELAMSVAELQAKYDIPIDVNESVVAYIRFFQSHVM